MKRAIVLLLNAMACSFCFGWACQAASITSVDGGGNFSIGLRSDGSVAAWGSNGYLILGPSGTLARQVPGTVTGLSGMIAISAGDRHAVALKSDHTV